MRLLRNLVVLVILCLILGAPAASAAEGPAVPAGREVGEMAHAVVGHFQAFLKAVWENTAFEIDPLGRNSPGAGGDSGGEPGTPSTDEAGYIDPWG